jgi:hypothetical protein
MHPEIQQHLHGRCPKCGMMLMLKKDALKTSMTEHGMEKAAWKNYMPLIAILVSLFLASLIVASPSFTTKTIMMSFMSGFFVVFSAFKLLDLHGFAQGYSTYDLLAKRWYTYGYIYPFMELFFGISMGMAIWQTQVLWLELLIMTFSGVGVLIKLLRHERFQCVCLGTFLRVPLTKVTLIEDFGMAILAAYLLFLV